MNTMNTMDWVRKNNMEGLILLIDFKKEFDSISFGFIKKTLGYFDFGTYITNWIKILLHNFKESIKHRGNILRDFSIRRGCRQGDLSSMLFILVIEILCIKIRTTKKLAGIRQSSSIYVC